MGYFWLNFYYSMVDLFRKSEFNLINRKQFLLYQDNLSRLFNIQIKTSYNTNLWRGISG